MGISRSKTIVGKPNPEAAGLEHVCFLPIWCINYGPSTSMYYDDPDENRVEYQVDNFDSGDDAVNFIEGPEFAMNPIGVEFDAENLLRELENGVNEKTLKKPADIGARTDLPAYLKRYFWRRIQGKLFKLWSLVHEADKIRQEDSCWKYLYRSLLHSHRRLQLVYPILLTSTIGHNSERRISVSPCG
jgi:hypothetical protein